MSKPCVVGFDSEMEGGPYWLYGWDEDCEGAITVNAGRPVIFPNRAEAMRAIRISTANAKLMKAQGKPACEDFLDDKAQVKILNCVFDESPTPGKDE